MSMINKLKTNYTHTIYACYIGYITQAIVNNLAPLLFVTFASEYDLTLDKITLITTINFTVQLLIDLFSAGFIDKIGYRASAILAHITAATGLILLSVLPTVLTNAYAGILIAVVIYAIGGGIIEVMISPVVEACPTDHKEKAMSLLHSFYCWGHLGVVILSTVFFKVFGIENWHLLTSFWAIVPIFNVFYFSIVPIYPIIGEGEDKTSIFELIKNKTFWFVFLLMICAGASEQGMSQWASAFAESALHVSKTMGDLLGPSAFALSMGIARALYGKFGDRIPLQKFMIGSALLCIFCYILAAFAPNSFIALIGCAVCGFSVGIFWPGTFSIAAVKIPGGGTAMYALLALAGDVGCGSGPTVVGFVANSFDGNLRTGLMVAMIFPIVIFTALSLTSGKRRGVKA